MQNLFRAILIALLLACAILVSAFIGSVWWTHYNPSVEPNGVIEYPIENEPVELTIVYKKEAVGQLRYGDDNFNIVYSWNNCYILDAVKFGDKSVVVKPYLPGGLDLLHPWFSHVVMPINEAESWSTLDPEKCKMHTENKIDYFDIKVTVSSAAWQKFRQGLNL